MKRTLDNHRRDKYFLDRYYKRVAKMKMELMKLEMDPKTEKCLIYSMR